MRVGRMEERNATTKNLTLAKVKELLESIGEENLDQFQRRTLNYASTFSRVKAEASEKLVEKFVKEFGLEEEEAVQIVNCMPTTVEELKIFLAGGRKIFETSKLEAIVSLLNDYRKSE